MAGCVRNQEKEFLPKSEKRQRVMLYNIWPNIGDKMFTLNIRSVIYALREAVHPHHGIFYEKDDEGFIPGLILAFNYSVDDYESSKRKSANGLFHILIAGHSTVFFSASTPTDRRQYWNLIPSKDWTNIGNHESCWIDSIENAAKGVYFNACAIVNPNKPPAKLTTMCSLGGIGNPYTLVRAKYKNRDEDLYFKDLIEIKTRKESK
jgi:hypothetical protein